MSAAQFEALLRWWCEELVRELLWSAWRRYFDAHGTPRAERFFRLFVRLVDATPCWPCRIEFTRDRLWITSSPELEDYIDDEFATA